MTSFDDSELVALAVEFGKMPAKAHMATRAALQEGSSDLKKEWQKNAEESSGEHGRLYPYSIDWEEKVGTDLVFEVGPNPDKHVRGGKGPGGQVGRAAEGYEFGSANQPAHLDGQRAADDLIPRIERRVYIASEEIF